MGRRGPAPKSTAEHIADGTYQPSRHGDRVDHVIAVGRPNVPEGLTPQEAAIFEWVVGCLHPRVLAAVDASAIAHYAHYEVQWRDLRQQWHDAKPDEQEDIEKRMERADKRQRAWGALLGVTPVDRVRIKLPITGRPEETGDPIQDLLSRRN